MTRMGDQAAGAAAGLIATLPMTLGMEAANRLLPKPEQGGLPPREVAMRVADATGIAEQMSEPERVAFAVGAHFGFGASAGSLYGSIARQLPWHPAVNGAFFGSVLWAGSYFAVLPAIRLFPPPALESTPRHAVMLGAHLVWGVALGVLTARLAGPTKALQRG